MGSITWYFLLSFFFFCFLALLLGVKLSVSKGEQEGNGVCASLRRVEESASLSDLLSLLVHLFLPSWSLMDSLFGQGDGCPDVSLDSYSFFIWKTVFY